MNELQVIEQHRMGRWARQSVAVLLALAVVSALLFGMQLAITPAEVQLSEKGTSRMLDFVRIKRVPEQLRTPEQLPDRQPETPPPPPHVPPLTEVKPRIAHLAVKAVPVELSIDSQLGGIAMPGLGEGDYLPMVKVAPEYPARARRRGIEGFCAVSYTVNAQGGTENLKVLTEQCSHEIFHKAVVQAAGRFRYKPRIVDGRSIAVADVITRFNFRLDN